MPVAVKTKAGYVYKDTKDERSRRNSDCFTNCLAYVLGVHPTSVPQFVKPPHKTWWMRAQAFARRRGYALRYYKTAVPKRGTYIVRGASAANKNWDHAVVYRNGKLAFDPSPLPTKWADSRNKGYFLLQKVRVAK